MWHPRTAHVATLLFGALISPAWAGFKACNETTNPVALAIAYSTGKDWISRGWWSLPSKSCAQIFDTLEARFYYLHAVHQQVGGGWVGNRSFCTAHQGFQISGRDKCEERGHQKAGFFEVDTKDAADYTHTLTD